jgi:aminoglycoside phosphotransferase (APT) family kinase protein
MTSSVVPDVASRLDEALPELAAALSPRPPGAVAGDDCRVRSVEWVPRRRCRVIQEIRGAGGTRLLAYEVTPSGTTVQGMADDRGLPGVPEALSPTRVEQRLAEICRAPVRECRVTPVSYRPATHAVLAYDVVTGSGRSRFFAKVLADGSDRYTAAAAAIAASAGRRDAPAPVPEVIALWRDLGAVVQRAAPGRVLSGVLRDESLPGRDRVRYAELLGCLLGGVHATPHRAQPRWTAEDELTALEALLLPTCHGDPAVGRSLAALVDRLSERVPANLDLVLSHGAFRSGQVLVDGDLLTLLDLDTVSGADAARDAGNALAYLSWADVRGALRPGLAPALHQAFLAGYAASRTDLPPSALTWWSAAAMAKIAGRRFRALATTEWPSVPGLLNGAVLLLDSAPSGAGASRRRLVAQRGAPPVGLLDPHLMTEVLRAEPSFHATPHVRVLDARPLAEAPGRRRVVRYEVEGLGTDRAVRLVGKVYADRHRALIAHENLRLLREQVFASTPFLTVPAPVCHIPSLRMVIYREVTGSALDRLPAGVAVTVAGAAAGWLATLHASDAVFARRLDLPHEVVNVEKWAACVGDRAPGARGAAYALADRLATTAGDLPAAREVPIHKDFHVGHVIALGDHSRADDSDVAAGGVAVIDLDEARMGDPALDLAHVTTYLDFSPWPGAVATRDAFLADYGPLPGPSPEFRSAYFAAYTSMKIAKQLVSGRGPLPQPPGHRRTAAVIGVLRRGLACLDG